MEEKTGAFAGEVEYPPIKGSTTISHADRVKFGLTCSEYVLIEYLDWLVEQKTVFEPMRCYQSTGFKADEIDVLLKRLIEKGFLIVEKKDEKEELRITTKWFEGRTNLIKEFEQFWTKTDKQGKTMVVWTGSKPGAFKLFVKLRKKLSLEYLLKQRDNYFCLLYYQRAIRGFDRQKMMATVFLNPESKRYEEDFLSQVPEAYRKTTVEKEETLPQPLTQEDLQQKYQ